MNKFKKQKLLVTFIGASIFITGCQSSFLNNSDERVSDSVLNVLSNKGEDAAHIAAINEVLDASVDNVPTILSLIHI